MNTQMPNQTSIADLTLNIPVEVHYALDKDGRTQIVAVNVTVGKDSLNVISLLDEDDFFDIFVQLDDHYHEVS
jgi:hypothetical protein